MEVDRALDGRARGGELRDHIRHRTHCICRVGEHAHGAVAEQLHQTGARRERGAHCVLESVDDARRVPVAVACRPGGEADDVHEGNRARFALHGQALSSAVCSARW